MIWSKTFKKIESALGFELHDWQKAYISMESDYIPEGRQTGATTAFILRHLLNYGEKIGYSKDIQRIRNVRNFDYWREFPCDHPEFTKAFLWDIYPSMVYKLDMTCKFVGLDTCFIFITEN